MSEAAHPAIYFIRHGETAWNRARRIQGQVDTELNARGHGQARAIARTLQLIEPDIAGFAIHASPLLRVRQTLQPILEAYGMGEDMVRFDERLREVSFGVMEGKTWPELNGLGIDPDADPEGYYHWKPAGGESYAEAARRVADWLDELERPAIVVAHGGVSRLLRGALLGLEPRQLVRLKVPQQRFFRIEGGEITWFDAREGAA